MSEQIEAVPDLNALVDAVKALSQSSSRQMLEANLRYLMDYFVDHPSRNLPIHLQPEAKENERCVKY